ncbi:hypothetical protein ACP275_14G075000 [Erythranthe tilingii]
MGVKVAAASLHWSQPSVPHSPSSSQSLPSAVSSKRRGFLTGCGGGGGDGALFCQYVERSAALSSKLLHRSQSCGGSKTTRVRIIRRAISASLDSFSDEEFSKQIQELALRFQLSDDDNNTNSNSDNTAMFMEKPDAFDPLRPCPDFPERDEITPSNIEWRANSFDIPLSLRIIKRKKQWQSGFAEAGESACCSVKKAFSSMVFIIQELHSFTLQMREVLFYEDLQGILASVQKEMQASFVWLFQKVFSHTPTLMVYVMILLANYSVYSISSNSALAAVAPPVQTYSVEEVSMVEDQTPSESHHKFDSSIVRTLKLSSNSNEDKISVGGNNGGGGGGKYPTVASGTDGDGTTNPNGALSSSILNPSRTSGGEELVSRQVSVDEETDLWNSIVDEASKMEAESRHEALDHETMQKFVSPVNAIIQADDYSDHFRTELLYQSELAQEPNNPLLLANYAQFLYLVLHDFDRAEDYFKRATKVEPKDGEALNKYANFLWLVRKDLWAAEETYLEAISAERNNSYYAANYAHFLWSTGGEETCFPIDSTDSGIEL